MADKKFLGKIHGEPWDALAKGPREALSTIWNDYLAEVLQISPKSERYKILRREIETAAGFKEVYESWNTLPPESRALAWRRLMTASRNLIWNGSKLRPVRRLLRQRQPCPAQSRSGTLLPGSPDVERRLYHEGRGKGHHPGGQYALREERLKVREVPGSRQCWFYMAATQPAASMGPARSSAAARIAGANPRTRPPRRNYCNAATSSPASPRCGN